MEIRTKFKVYILNADGAVEDYFSEWIGENGEWFHSAAMPKITEGAFSYRELGDGFLGQVKREPFTGLEDKEGQEIYRNDVLEWCGGKYVVKQWKGKFVGFDVKHSGIRLDLAAAAAKEVIGNIYEDPELLTQTKI